MVSGTRAIKIFGALFLRILLLIGVLTVGLLTAVPFHEFNENVLGYSRPSGFFGFTLADWELAWLLSSVFWSGIVFGMLSKKIDYAFIIIIFLFVLWDYSYPPAVSTSMYTGLFGVALLGNVLGYMLKLARQRWMG